MDCPLIRLIGTPDVDPQCLCPTGRVGRWVTFRWQVDASAAPGVTSFYTAVNLDDGTQWLTARSVAGTPNQTDYQSRVFLEPGSYRWTVIILEPAECRIDRFSELVTIESFTVPACCDQVADLAGQIRIFSVRDGQPEFDLTDELKELDCVTTDSVIARLLPDSGCALTIEWVSPVLASASSANTTQPIPLAADGSPSTIRARVTLAGCPVKELSKVVSKCVFEGEKDIKKKWWCLGGDGCRLYEAMAIYPIIGFFFFMAMATLILVEGIRILISNVGGSAVGGPFAVGVTASATGVLVLTLFYFFLGLASACLLCVFIFHCLWWNCCTPTFCRYLEDLDWLFGWTMLICLIVPVGGWFFLPIQFVSFFVIRSLMISNRCAPIPAMSLPHMR